jgi:beta-N-acetylhexosaminidase
MIMVGHACYPAFGEPTIPACLSARIVDRLLRRKLAYSGVIVTDDMTLGAVTSLGLTPERFWKHSKLETTCCTSLRQPH